MSSKLSCAGLLVGFVLLGVAGVLFVTKSSLLVEDSLSGRRLYSGGYVPYNSRSTGTTWHLGLLQGANILVYYGVLIVEVLLWVIFAIIYKQRAVDPVTTSRGTLKDKQMQPANDFEHDICSCMQSPWVCVHGWCCPIARMAATNKVSGVLGYWPTVGVWCVAATCFSGCCGPSIVTVFFRIMLKKVMNIKDNMCFDIVIACCCPCLSVCQQGSAVDHAMGYEVVGCCDIEWQDISDDSNVSGTNSQSIGAPAKSPKSPLAPVV